jgi:hypothetical protein
MAPTVSEKVVAFCQANLGKQVGDGECYTLAAQALKTAGARPQHALGDNPDPGDYVWGKLVCLLEAKEGQPVGADKAKAVKPGDVVQFRDVRFDGQREDGGTYFWNFNHHTAVVAGLKNGDRELQLLHQNANGKRFVHEFTCNLDDLKAGWLRVYRPIPR